MQAVTFETAKRLAEAGFPQPKPQVGQVWFLNETAGLVITATSDVSPGICNYVTAFGTSRRGVYMDDGEIFAPTATDILRELPEYAVVRHIDYCGQSGEAWFCWDTLDRAKTFSHPTNPAEAAALAWLHENKKK